MYACWDAYDSLLPEVFPEKDAAHTAWQMLLALLLGFGCDPSASASTVFWTTQSLIFGASMAMVDG